MKFLADMDISPKAATFLQDLKYDAAHLHELGLDMLSDADILEKAISEERILITHDLGFGELIAKRKSRINSINRSKNTTVTLPCSRPKLIALIAKLKQYRF